MEPTTDGRDVFVVYGRDGRLRHSLFEFLRTLDLRPLEWSKAVAATATGSPYVGEVLDAAFGLAAAIVVLITPDDEVRLKEEFRSTQDPEFEHKLTGQARPNVLFEAGMAIGRNEERTILVEIGNSRPFSDVAGRHTIRLNNSAERRQELALRLISAGCAVGQGTDFLSAGDFDYQSGPSNGQPPADAPSSRATHTDQVDSVEAYLESTDIGRAIVSISNRGSHLIQLKDVQVGDVDGVDLAVLNRRVFPTVLIPHGTLELQIAGRGDESLQPISVRVLGNTGGDEDLSLDLDLSIQSHE